MARKENAVVRAAKAVVKPLRDASKKVDEIVEQEAPRAKPAPKDKPEDARFVRGLGERIGFAGVVAVTVGAALFGAVGCRESASTVLPVATCDEPAAWCRGGQR